MIALILLLATTLPPAGSSPGEGATLKMRAPVSVGTRRPLEARACVSFLSRPAGARSLAACGAMPESAR